VKNDYLMVLYLKNYASCTYCIYIRNRFSFAKQYHSNAASLQVNINNKKYMSTYFIGKMNQYDYGQKYKQA